ncbi:MAG: carboxypeptidase regulatory-like domain-containing protein [Gemmatimonadetes bacterium]|nr:MAG: carboxypeptidase regulatory-like domain-containing protein [Gemmatimonadota bacterium]
MRSCSLLVSLCVAAAAVGVATVAPAPARAQQVLRGRILDDSTRVGVVGADVQVALDDSVLVGRVSTGAGGMFAIRLPRGGLYRLQVSSLGYRTRTSRAFPVPEGDTVDVVFSLEPDAITLPGLTVEGDRPGPRRGREVFEERRAAGEGYFVTRAQIDSLKPLEVGEILELVDGVRVSWVQKTLDDGRRQLTPEVTSKLGTGCLVYAVDDRVMRPEDRLNPWAVFPLSALRPQDIEAVEVYRHLGEAPRELRNQAWIPITQNSGRTVRGMGVDASDGLVITNRYEELTCGMIVFRTRAAW